MASSTIIAFTLEPLRWFMMFRTVHAGGSFPLVLVLAQRRLILGSEEGGTFALRGRLFLLVSVASVGIGLLGEYVGRAYQDLRSRQRYILSRSLAPET